MKALTLTFWLLWRSLRSRMFANILTLLAVLIGVGLALVVPLSVRAFQQGATDAVRIFDLLIAAEGGETQAVLSSLYYQDAPLANMPYRVFEALQNDPRTVRAVPLGFGDNFAGFPIVGTTSEYFELRYRPDDPPYFELAAGSFFSAPEEVVLGSKAAAETGLGLGDSFAPAHGMGMTFEPSEHAHEYQVVGILAATGAPADRAIFTAIESVWEAHAQYAVEEAQINWTLDALNDPSPTDSVDNRGVDNRGVTAILWAPQNLADTYTVANIINSGVAGVQAIFPAEVLARLSLNLGQGERIYESLGNIVLLLAIITIALNTYMVALQSQRDLAILRVVGVRRVQVAGVVLLESALISLLGIALGVVAAYLATSALGSVLSAETSLTLKPPALSPGDWLRVSALLPVALLCALLPALRSARRSPLESL